MSQIEKILGFEFTYGRVLHQQPDFAQVQSKLKKNIQKLISIQGKEPLYPHPDPISVSNLYRKFIDVTSDNGLDSLSEQFSRREIRSLSCCLLYCEELPPYNIPIIQSAKYTTYCINLFQNNFRNAMLIPLFNAHMESWIYWNERMVKFLKKQIEAYNGRNTSIINIKNNAQWYFDRRGATNIAIKFCKENKSPKEVWNFLALPNYTYSYSYFSEFIIQYTKTIIRDDFSENHIKEIQNFLEKHKKMVTNKKVLSKIIKKLGINAPEKYRDVINIFVLNNIGDPSHQSSWQYANIDNVSDDEKRDLSEAREIFNEWYTKDCIEFFFERISRSLDPEGFKYRKAFWLSYAKHISYFKIIASRYAKDIISGDPKSELFINNRFSRLDGADFSQCAFLFTIKDYIFVEFAKIGGALYIYKNKNSKAPKIENGHYFIDELRQPNAMNYLMKDDGIYRNYYEEGRFMHHNPQIFRWQDRLQWWLNKVLDIRPFRDYRVLD